MIVVLDREFRMYDSNDEEISYAISELEQAIESKPKTNADRIRNMSDEELAEFLLEVNSTIQHCMIYDCKYEDEREGICKDCFLEWLQAEVKEGENDD